MDPSAPPLAATSSPPPGPDLVGHASLWELVHVLGNNRRAVLLGYLIVLAVVLLAWVVCPLVLASPLMPVGDQLRSEPVTREGLGWRLLMAAGFVGLQALFLGGGGRVRVGLKPVSWRRRAIPLLLFATLMTLAAGGLITALWEMPGRNADVLRTLENPPAWFVILLALNWSVWLVMGWLVGRSVDQPTGLGRLAALLVGGSWLQFAVALPVDLAARQRHAECPCESGSYLGLGLAYTLLLWAIGPGLYLLYLREQRLTDADPRHARRVLQRRSQRVRPDPST